MRAIRGFLAKNQIGGLLVKSSDRLLESFFFQKTDVLALMFMQPLDDFHRDVQQAGYDFSRFNGLGFDAAANHIGIISAQILSKFPRTAPPFLGKTPFPCGDGGIDLRQ